MSELRLLIRKSELNGSTGAAAGATSGIAHPRTLEAPPSKSYTHRALLAAALTRGKTTIRHALLSADTRATIDALQELGARITVTENGIEVDGTATFSGNNRRNTRELDCGESGTTLRFLIPVCALANAPITLTGKPGLCKRPTGEVVQALRKAGVEIEDRNGLPPVRITGGLRGGELTLRGDVSSQFISGLLFALPLAERDSAIRITGKVESLPYIEMTLDILRAFGISIHASPDRTRHAIAGRQTYRSPGEYILEGDYSSAAFLLAAGALAGPGVEVKGLRPDSVQGDRMVLSILKKMGATIGISGDSVRVKKSLLRAIPIDAQNIPDLVPILVVLATQAKGKTKITNAGRLRIKESDRLSAIAQELKKMGASITETKDGLEIRGPTPLRAAEIDPHNDHRIAMACTVAGLIAEGETLLMHPEAVQKSYPDFFYHLRALGATILSETGSIGDQYRIQLYGGSHERCIGVRINGIPKETSVSMDKIREDLDKRKPFGTLTTPRREQDTFSRVEGIRNGAVTGDTVVFETENNDVDSRPYERTRFTPRPNHGDYTTWVKYGGAFDFRGGGFLSARMTVGTVIAGSIAKQILEEKGIRFAAYVRQIGPVALPRMPSLENALQTTYASEVRCPDPETSNAMKAAIEKARSEQDSLGGIIECQVHGLPVGIGEPIFNAIDSVLAHYLFSIPAVKGVEFGAGFDSASRRGSENNDRFEMKDGRVVTATNHSGGILGGISSGMPLVCRVAIKPTSSIAREQTTVNMQTWENTVLRVLGRHDPCVAIRAPIIVETMVAIGVLDLLLRSK